MIGKVLTATVILFVANNICNILVGQIEKNKKNTREYLWPHLRNQPPLRVHPHIAEYCDWKEDMYYLQ